METAIVAVVSLIVGLGLGWILAGKKKPNQTEETGELQMKNAVLQAQLDNSNTVGQEMTRRVDLLTAELQEAGVARATAESRVDSAVETIGGLRINELEAARELERLQGIVSSLREDNAQLKARQEETQTRLIEQQEFVNQANVKLKDAFQALSADALKNNNESFVTLAKSTLETQVNEAKGDFDKKQQAIDALVKPLSASLEKFDGKIEDFEKKRAEQHGQLNQFIQGVQQSTEKLQKETQSLVGALKTSHGRGRYGEIALRRVVEVAGMTDHCDFEEQVSVSTDDGILRPDMTIRLPDRKTIVVDSKVPLSAYMRAFETEDEDEKRMCFIQHAAAVRDHLKKLSQKAYWTQFADSPDYVVLYMQIESSFGIALQTDPLLIEDAIRNNIIFATPTTLITLLRTASFVWQQVSVAENIEQIKDAGIELYNRTTTLIGHFAQIGSNLKTAVGNYNKAVSSLESRFIPQAKKVYELGSAYTKNVLPDIEQIEIVARELQAPEGEVEP
jgi:DNA recombination protein RmuC